MKKEKTKGPGRPWDQVPRVEPRIARVVRFPPELFKALARVAKQTDESIEGFIKKAVRERVERLLK